MSHTQKLISHCESYQKMCESGYNFTSLESKQEFEQKNIFLKRGIVMSQTTTSFLYLMGSIKYLAMRHYGRYNKYVKTGIF